MEVGMGIHGEAGIEKTKLKPSKEIADIMVNRILADKDYGHSEVAAVSYTHLDVYKRQELLSVSFIFRNLSMRNFK